MYDTSFGERVLRGAEARLFAGAAWRLTDDLRCWIPSKPGEPRTFGISNPLLDPLTAEQVLVLIDRVTAYLLEADIKAPVRTALLDATIATIYQQVTANVEVEIDSASPAMSEYEELDERHQYDERSSVVAVCYQTVDPNAEYCEIPDPDCDDMEIWQELIDRLRDRILPDQDWGLEAMAMDLPPDKSADLKQWMGIQGDYFIDTVPDASLEDAATAWCNLLERITGVRPEFWRFGAGIPMPEDAVVPPRYDVLSFSDGPEQWEDCEASTDDAEQTTPVLLSDVVAALQLAPDGWSSYINSKTGEVAGLDSDDYLVLPSQLDQHERSIMRDFCKTQSDSDRESLFNAIDGKDAFRLFKSTVRNLGLDDQWYPFRDQAIEAFVIHWLESNSVNWTRTRPGEPPF